MEDKTLFGEGRHSIPDDPISSSSSSSSSRTHFRQDELARICDELLVHGGGRREIEIDERERLAEDEAREVAQRKATVRSRKRQLHELGEEDEESTSEKEDERQHEMRELESELETLGDGVRVPEPSSVTMLEVSSSHPESSSFVVTEPSTDANSYAMWEPTFSERALMREELRANFIRIYPGNLEHRHAVVRALLAAAGPRPSLGLREHVELARSSLMLLTRKTEDDLLRTPKVDERYCRNEYNCELYKIHGKIARECLKTVELEEFERSGNLPFERRPCLGCMRYNVTWFWMYMRWRGEHVGTAFISGHYNLTNMRGEYLQDQCLLSSTYGLPLHVVPFVPGALVLREEVRDGEAITIFAQTGMVRLDNESDFP